MQSGNNVFLFLVLVNIFCEAALTSEEHLEYVIRDRNKSIVFVALNFGVITFLDFSCMLQKKKFARKTYISTQ